MLWSVLSHSLYTGLAPPLALRRSSSVGAARGRWATGQIDHGPSKASPRLLRTPIHRAGRVIPARPRAHPFVCAAMAASQAPVLGARLEAGAHWARPRARFAR